MGNILLNYEGEYDRAIGYFRTLVEQYPNNGYYRRLLVRTLFNQQRSSEVISEAKNALNHWELKQLESEKVLREEILYWRGRAHYRMGNMEAAADDFQQTINLGKELSNTENRPFYLWQTTSPDEQLNGLKIKSLRNLIITRLLKVRIMEM